MRTLTIVFILFTIHSVHSQILPLTNMNFPDTEIENSGCTFIFEDKDGFLWFSSYPQGLVKYDGKNLELLYQNNNLPEDIRDIHQDEYGYLWILGQSQNLDLPMLYVSHRPVSKDLISDSLTFKNEHWDTPLLADKKAGHSFSISKDGKFMTHSDSILVQYYYHSETSLVADTLHDATKDEVKGKIISAIYLRDGSVVFTTHQEPKGNYHVLKWDGKQFLPRKTFDNVPTFVCRHSDEKGGVWGMTLREGYYIPDGLNPDLAHLKEYLTNGNYNTSALIDENTLLVGSRDVGLFEIDTEKGQVIKHYTTNDGLSSSSVFDICVGKDNIWIGSMNGILAMPKNYRAFQAYNSDYKVNGQPYLPQDPVNALATKINIQGDSREYWATSTSGGLVLSNKEGDYALIDESNGLQNSTIIGVTQDSKGRIWVGLAAAGVNCIYPKGTGFPYFKNKRTLNLFGKEYLSGYIQSSYIYTPEIMTVQSDDSTNASEEVLVGADSDWIQLLFQEQPWVIVPEASGYKSNTELNLSVQDNKGYLYVANLPYGLMRSVQPLSKSYVEQIRKSGKAKPGKRVIVSTEKIMEKVPLSWKDTVFNEVHACLIYKDELWLSVEKGMLVLSTDDLTAKAFIPLPHQDPGYIIQSICQDQNSIWGGTAYGLAEYDLASYTFKRIIRSGDGLLNEGNWVPFGLSADTDGVLHYGTAEGLIRFDPKRFNEDTSNIEVVIRDVKYAENNWGKNELNVDYIALTYDDPKRMRYKTRLLGYDDNWSEASDRTDIRYTNLSAFMFPKTYNFEVMASDYRGVWHELKTAFPIKVQAPMWTRWWAFLLYAIAIFFMARAYINWRLEQQKKNIALEEAKVIKEKNTIIEKKNQENELLLKEIHHRVKNNLQTISSLLNLQAESITDPTALDAVQESQNRVASMALIHQKLYQGENLAAIEMKDYFKTIGKSILYSFGEIADKVQLKVDMDELELDVDTAIPIGLITNELMTNSLKYAFKKKEKGALTISMKKEADNMMHLLIADDGDFDHSSALTKAGTGFGSLLVQLLTAQLDGKIEQNTTSGTATILRFPIKQQEGKVHETPID